jgi:hypothetical protein
VTATAAASQSSTEFHVTASINPSCTVQSFDLQQRDITARFDQTWADIAFQLAAGSGSGAPYSATVNADGFPGHHYQFRARTRQVGGTSDWSAISTTVTVAADATTPQPFTALYTLDAYGSLHGLASPPLTPSATWPGWNIARSAKALPGSGDQAGMILDGYGGLHPYGEDASTATVQASAYWQGWDIARDFGIVPDGSGGYVMDGYGGLHPFGINGGTAPSAVPTVAYQNYWPGWDIARRVVILPDGRGGYIMDGYGGLHPFGIGGNPKPPAVPLANYQNYWPGWNIARSVVLLPNSTDTSVAGYLLDGYGGLHPFAVSHGLPPAIVRQQWVNYWQGWDLARDFVLLSSSDTAATSGYLLDGFGGAHPIAANQPLPPAITVAAEINYWPGYDVAKVIVGP